MLANFSNFSRVIALFAGLLALGGQTQAQAQPAAPAQAASNAPAGPRVWVSPPAGSPARGQLLYAKTCAECHAPEKHGIGPAHQGVFGRRIGSAAGYKYSDGMANSRLRWTAQTLNAWLAFPEDLIAGQRMNVEVESAQDRADLIAYLATLK